MVIMLLIRGGPYADHSHVALASGRYYTLLLFLPATIMVMRRPNEGSLPAWLEARIAAWPKWLRGTSVDSGTRSAASHQSTR
ncbi:MAG: hypothetical protein DMD35_15685 [Gemmatimonadetes bacterium]|nr:MAG: hypothetical protein DMD35_15685 [Gemmatimonadota bacterium]